MRYFLIIFFTYNIVCAQISVEELGIFGGYGSKQGEFKSATALDISQDGKVYVCDRLNHRIQIFDQKGNFIKDVGGLGWDNEQFDEPLDLWARSTINIFVADYNNQRVQRFDRKMNFISAMYSNQGLDERFQFLEVLSVAYSSQGDLFILDAGENKVIKFQGENGKAAFGYYESGAGELYDPVQIDITPDHRIIVSDKGNAAVNVYDYFGSFLYAISNEEMQKPQGLAVDKTGRIYVADNESNAIFVYMSSGKFLGKIEQINGTNLKGPLDITVNFIKNNSYICYILDRDYIIVCNLKFSQPTER